MPATPPLRGDSGAPMRGGMRPGASMLWRHEFNTSGQAPSSGASGEPLPWSGRGRSPEPPSACRPRLPDRPDRGGRARAGSCPPRTSATRPCCTASWRSTAPACIARSGSWRISATRCPTRAPGCCASASRSRAAAAGGRWPSPSCWWSPARRRRRSSTCWRSRASSTGCRTQIDATSWPSGHSTAAMTLALCAVLVAPPALRAATALLGGAFAVGVGYAVLVLGWHFPSDVLGGFLVAGLWTSLAVAVLHRVEAPEPARRPAWEPLGAPSAPGAAVVAAVVLGVRADTVALYTLERPTFVAGALTIALLALAAGDDGQRRVDARRTPSPLSPGPDRLAGADQTPIARSRRAGSPSATPRPRRPPRSRGSARGSSRRRGSSPPRSWRARTPSPAPPASCRARRRAPQLAAARTAPSQRGASTSPAMRPPRARRVLAAEDPAGQDVGGDHLRAAARQQRRGHLGALDPVARDQAVGQLRGARRRDAQLAGHARRPRRRARAGQLTMPHARARHRRPARRRRSPRRPSAAPAAADRSRRSRSARGPCAPATPRAPRPSVCGQNSHHSLVAMVTSSRGQPDAAKTSPKTTSE